MPPDFQPRRAAPSSNQTTAHNHACSVTIARPVHLPCAHACLMPDAVPWMPVTHALDLPFVRCRSWLCSLKAAALCSLRAVSPSSSCPATSVSSPWVWCPHGPSLSHSRSTTLSSSEEWLPCLEHALVCCCMLSQTKRAWGCRRVGCLQDTGNSKPTQHRWCSECPPHGGCMMRKLAMP